VIGIRFKWDERRDCPYHTMQCGQNPSLRQIFHAPPALPSPISDNSPVLCLTYISPCPSQSGRTPANTGEIQKRYTVLFDMRNSTNLQVSFATQQQVNARYTTDAGAFHGNLPHVARRHPTRNTWEVSMELGTNQNSSVIQSLH
jgi:hypothetical protein